MFDWLKRKGPKSSESQSRTANQPTKVGAKKLIEVAPQKPILSKEEIDSLRKSEFKELGIPYELVLAAEVKGVKGINPTKLAAEIAAINSKLITFGFNIRIGHLEGFECQLLYLDYQRMREFNQKTRGIILPEHSLINIVILREAEKMVRGKYDLPANPITGEAAKKFQSEVKTVFEALWKKSLEYQLRQQAQKRIRKERNLSGNEPLLEADVTAMMETIKAERAVIAKNLNNAIL